MPYAYESKKCRFDVPFGTIDRGTLDDDVPANSFAVPLASDGPALALDGRFLTVTGNVRVTAFKVAENGRDVVVRLHNNGGEQTAFSLTLAKAVSAADLADLNVTPIAPLTVNGNTVNGTCKPYGICTVLVE